MKTENKKSEYDDYNREIGEKTELLLKKYDLNIFDFDPEFVYSSKDLKWFGEKIASKLYPYDKYEFIKDFTSANGEFFITEFNFNDSLISIKSRTDTDFISGNWVEQLKLMEKLSLHGFRQTSINPGGPLISGKVKALKMAQYEGLPISFEERLFWYTDYDGKKLDKSKQLFIELEFESDVINSKNLNEAFFSAIKELSKISNRLHNYTKEQVRVCSRGNGQEFRLFIDGDLVGFNHIKKGEKTLHCNKGVGGQILAYGMLMNYEAKIRLKPLKESLIEDILKISPEGYQKRIEEKIKDATNKGYPMWRS